MAAKRGRKRAGNSTPAEPQEQITDLRLIARVLGLAVVRGRTMGEQCGLLSAAGFAVSEIASLIGTTPASVRQQTYNWRKGGGVAQKKATRKE